MERNQQIVTGKKEQNPTHIQHMKVFLVRN